MMKKTTTRLATTLAVLAGAMISAQAAGPAIQGSLGLRPLTPQDLKTYNLPTAQLSGGLATVGLGQPAYLDVLVNNALPAADVTNVTWVLTAAPIGSTAALVPSPLGTNVPPYKIADQFSSSGARLYRVGARSLLVPDLVGQYSVRVTIQTRDSGSTNLTQDVVAGTYMGAYTCALCHSGGVVADNTYVPWTGTLHSHAFKDAINGVSTDHFSSRCVSCHVVGYDAAPGAVNGGFDDVATQLGWTFPTNVSTGNWDAMPAALKNVANVQCENCHGPGSQHAYSLGRTNLISRTYAAGSCAQCHDSLSHHYKTAEWSNSRHAVATRSPSGPTRTQCVRCHTAAGFADFVSTGNVYGSNTVYEAITCAACHDPHDASNPHQLRAAPLYTLPDGTTVTNVGLGALCMQCHHSRNGEATQNITNYMQGKPTWAGGSSFGVHDSTAGDVIEGVNAITYGKVIPSGTHSVAIQNTCVGCHMQPVAAGDPAFTKAGGHTFSMTYNAVANGVTNTVDKVDVCVQCHGPMEDFNLVRKDYNGDGMIEGIQTEVQKLLNQLSTLLPNSTYRADGNYVADGVVKSSISVKTNWPVKFLNAAWNWQLMNVEGSKGIHNAPFTVGVLKASIADLTGDANNDGLSDAWQIQYFGSVTNRNAAPNATPAGDGIPNWLKFGLGLNPMVAGIVVPDGVVWANGSKIGGSVDTIRIYTAAEIAFDTEVGSTYQIQAISTLGGGWTNVGAPIPGTGAAISYVTPTRSKLQQYYRVVRTP